MKENNKLLAEFLGITFKDNRFECNTLYNELIKENSYITFLEEVEEIDINSHLHFHNDWNWLMQVVEKIESLGLNQRKFTVKISYDVCSIDFTSLHERRETPLIFKRSTDQRNKIEAVYNACVEFVEWWNKENN